MVPVGKLTMVSRQHEREIEIVQQGFGWNVSYPIYTTMMHKDPTMAQERKELTLLGAYESAPTCASLDRQSDVVTFRFT